MKTVEKYLYEYEDLLKPENSGLLEKVIENYFYINVEHDWASLENYSLVAELMGFYNFNVLWSGFHSQGDGACFECRYQYEKQSVKKIKKEFPSWLELHELAKELQDLQQVNLYQVLGGSKHSGHYYHEYCMDISLERNDYKEIINEKGFFECFRKFARLIYESLNEDYNNLTSKESILETIEANNYTFNEYGKIEY